MTDHREPCESSGEHVCQLLEALAKPEDFAAELVGDPGPDGTNPVASEVAAWVRRSIEAVRSRIRRGSGERPARKASRGSIVAGTATATAVGALEGTLKGKSLEGSFKLAQILDAYASARQKNAEAQKLEAEARKLAVEEEKLRQDMAFERLERVLDLTERLGAPVAVAQLPNGGFAITTGERLVAELAGSAPTPNQAELLAPSMEGSASTKPDPTTILPETEIDT